MQLQERISHTFGLNILYTQLTLVNLPQFVFKQHGGLTSLVDKGAVD